MKNLDGNQNSTSKFYFLDFVLSNLSDLKAEHRSKTQNYKDNTCNSVQDLSKFKKMTLSDYKEELKIKKVGNQNENNDTNPPAKQIEDENKFENYHNHIMNASNYPNFQNSYSYNNYYNYNMGNYYSPDYFMKQQTFNFFNDSNNYSNDMNNNNFSALNNKISQLPLNSEEIQYYKKIFDFLTDDFHQANFLEARKVADFLKTSNLHKVKDVKNYLI